MIDKRAFYNDLVDGLIENLYARTNNNGQRISGANPGSFRDKAVMEYQTNHFFRCEVENHARGVMLLLDEHETQSAAKDL